MLRLEHEVSLAEWERENNAFKIHVEEILFASELDKDNIQCIANQTTVCSFSCDVISRKLYFDLQVLRYFLRINAIVDSKTELTLQLFESITFLCFAQELLNTNISFLSGIAFSLYSDKILPCFNNPDYWEIFDYSRALEKTRIQAMFLFGHEVFHLRLSTDPDNAKRYLKETQESIFSVAYPDVILSTDLNEISQNARTLEEFACDAFSCEAVINIASSEQISLVDVALDIYAGVLNQFLLLQTKHLAMAAIDDLETSIAFVKAQLVFLIIRTQVLNAKIAKCLKLKSSPGDVQLYLERSVLLYNNWVESTIHHLINTFDQFKSAVLNNRVNDRVLFYMKTEARMEQGEGVDNIEEIIKRRVLDEWDAFDSIISL